MKTNIKVTKITISILVIIMLTNCSEDPITTTNIAPDISVIILDYGILNFTSGDDYLFENYDPLSDDYNISNDTLFVHGQNLFNKAEINITSNHISYIDAIEWSEVDFINEVTFDDLTLKLSAFCDVISPINMSGNNFTIINWKPDSDTVIINSLNTNNINIQSRHFSSTLCTGSTDLLYVNSTGFSGEFIGYDLDAKEVTVENHGIADVQLLAINQLNATIFSIGNIYYKGQPTIDFKDYGIGNLIDAN